MRDRLELCIRMRPLLPPRGANFTRKSISYNLYTYVLYKCALFARYCFSILMRPLPPDCSFLLITVFSPRLVHFVAVNHHLCALK